MPLPPPRVRGRRLRPTWAWWRVPLIALGIAASVAAKEVGVVVVGLIPLWLWYQRVSTGERLTWPIVSLAVCGLGALVWVWPNVRGQLLVGPPAPDVQHGPLGYAAMQSLAWLNTLRLIVRPDVP